MITISEGTTTYQRCGKVNCFDHVSGKMGAIYWAHSSACPLVLPFFFSVVCLHWSEMWSPHQTHTNNRNFGPKMDCMSPRLASRRSKERISRVSNENLLILSSKRSSNCCRQRPQCRFGLATNPILNLPRQACGMSASCGPTALLHGRGHFLTLDIIIIIAPTKDRVSWLLFSMRTVRSCSRFGKMRSGVNRDNCVEQFQYHMRIRNISCR